MIRNNNGEEICQDCGVVLDNEGDCLYCDVIYDEEE